LQGGFSNLLFGKNLGGIFWIFSQNEEFFCEGEKILDKSLDMSSDYAPEIEAKK